MNITRENCYIDKHDSDHAIFLEYSDNSRNFLHSQTLDLEKALLTRDRLIGKSTSGHGILRIVLDGSYYRLNWEFVFYDSKTDNSKNLHLKFHSRKLNIHDALREYDEFKDIN